MKFCSICRKVDVGEKGFLCEKCLTRVEYFYDFYELNGRPPKFFTLKVLLVVNLKAFLKHIGDLFKKLLRKGV